MTKKSEIMEDLFNQSEKLKKSLKLTGAEKQSAISNMIKIYIMEALLDIRDILERLEEKK